MRAGPVVAVGAAGLVLAVALAWAQGYSAADTVALVSLAVGGALAAGVLGVVLLHRLRSRPVRTQTVVVALVSLVGTVVGVVLAASAMFVSGHDLGALLVVVVSSGTVGILAALALGSRVGSASRSLGERFRRIGGDEVAEARSDASVVGPEEFSRLADELERMSARLDASRERERALEASRRELVAWVSHDLRTPLAGIRAMVEALEDGVVDDPGTVRRYHRTMRSEADRLATLVDDLFELSRIQAGALELTLERVSLDDVVSDAVVSATPVATAKGVTVEGRSHRRAPSVELSTHEMGRVIRNLLDNAIRHTPPGGEVTVEVGDDEGRAYLSVADSCGGLPEKEMGRVFDPGYRGDAARTPSNASGGAGLGLAIARGFVEAHRGEIAVRNDGGGCRFTVRLPMG